MIDFNNMEQWEINEWLFQHACEWNEEEEDLDNWTGEICEYVEDPDYRKTLIEMMDWLKANLTFNNPLKLKGLSSKYHFKDEKDLYHHILIVNHKKGLYTLNPIGVAFIEDVLNGQAPCYLCEYDPYVLDFEGKNLHQLYSDSKKKKV